MIVAIKLVNFERDTKIYIFVQKLYSIRLFFFAIDSTFESTLIVLYAN